MESFGNIHKLKTIMKEKSEFRKRFWTLEGDVCNRNEVEMYIFYNIFLLHD